MGAPFFLLIASERTLFFFFFFLVLEVATWFQGRDVYLGQSPFHECPTRRQSDFFPPERLTGRREYHVRRPLFVESAHFCQSFSKIELSGLVAAFQDSLSVMVLAGTSAIPFESDGLHPKRFKCWKWESQITAYHGEPHLPDDGSDTGQEHFVGDSGVEISLNMLLSFVFSSPVLQSFVSTLRSGPFATW